MRTQFISVFARSGNRLGILCAAIAGMAASGTPAWGAEELIVSSASASASAAASVSTDWLEQVIEWVEKLYILIGGDPTDLDKAETADAQIAVLVNQFAAHGITKDLSPSDKALAIEDIQVLYAVTLLPMEGVSEGARMTLHFQLENMWIALGLPPSEL